jgi:hypothetical protein
MSDFTIVVDTREQRPWSFDQYDVATVNEPLETGDYSVKDAEDSFAIERKSLDDLAGCTYGDNHERFRREIVRGEQMDKFIVLIECPRSHLYNYQNRDDCPHYYSDVHPNSVIGMIEKWSKRYNIEGFCFSGTDTDVATQAYTMLRVWNARY